MEIESALPLGSTSLWVCKEVFRFLLSKVFDLFVFILYWYDIGSDILLAIKLKENCHRIYLITSTCIMGNSLFQSINTNGEIYTLASMTSSERKKSKQCYCSWVIAKKYLNGYLRGIFLPIHLIHLSLKLLINGIEGMTKAEKLQPFCIKFSEGIMESLPQLMLSFYVILQHGLEEWVQVASILGSSLSLLCGFSMRHAYLKNSHYPTKKEIFVAGLDNIIPMTLFYVGQFVFITILIYWSNNFGSIHGLVYLILPVFGMILFLQTYDNGMKYQSLKEFANIFTCTRTVLIFFFIITVSHTEKTIRYMSYDTNSTAVLQDLEKNETNTTNIYLTPFKNCPNATLEEDFEPYQKNVIDENQELFMYLIWSLLLIGIAHAYSEWRNESKNGIKSALVVDFILNERLVVESLEEVDEENKSDIENENEEMEIDNPNERYLGV